MKTDYAVPKPVLPVAAYLLGACVLFGLLGLGLVAYSVFAMVDTFLVALAFAAVIEFGMISEAVSILRGNWYAAVGILISLIVSGFYNYTKVAQAAALLSVKMGGFEIVALAIGPLSAVFFLALSFGLELKQHEASLGKWNENYANWLKAQQDQAKQQEAEKEDKARALELEKARLETEAKKAVELERIKAEERQHKREWKGRTSTATSTTEGRTSTEAVAIIPGTYEDFQALLRNNGTHHYTNKELSDMFHRSERTITDWRTKARMNGRSHG